MKNPVTAKLSDDLIAVQKRWREASRPDQERIYYREFAPKFAPLFAELPLHGHIMQPPNFKALISILGLSWQPVALMAAWVKPAHILVIGTDKSFEASVDDVPVQQMISEISGLPSTAFSYEQVGESEDLEIYSAVRKFITNHGLKPHEVAIDPTGGKKSMSISAGLAGSLTGAWIIYVDYKEYLTQPRIPLAGTEYPRLLDNPLEVFGDLEFQKIWDACSRGAFDEAGRIARELTQKLYDPREAEALELFSRAYGSWHKFDFKGALASLTRLQDYLARFQRFGRWQWANRVAQAANIHIPLLQEIIAVSDMICNGTKTDTPDRALCLVFNHLEASKRHLSYNQSGAAILLAYATLERFIDLALWYYFDIDDENPDLSNVTLDLEKFHEAGRALYAKRYRESEPAGPIGLSLGVQILHALKPELMPLNAMAGISRMIQHRNKCEYEHGLCPTLIKAKDVEKHIGIVRRLLTEVLKPMDLDVDKELLKFRFPLPYLS